MKSGKKFMLLGIVVFALLWFFTYYHVSRFHLSSVYGSGSRLDVDPGGRGEQERMEYPVVILGDSIMGLCRDETSVSERLSEKIGKPILNGAFGGTCMVFQEQELTSNYNMELLSMACLVKAIAADDFGAQQTIRSRREATDYFEDTVDELARVDFQKVEILILEFGLNDYHAGIPLENEKDPMDESTYCGAMRSVLTTLRASCPNLEIVMVTPTYTWYLSNKLTCEEYETGPAFLEDYVNAELAIAEEYGIEILDLYHDFYTHEEWQDWKKYSEDGLHPDEAARERIAEKIAQMSAFAGEARRIK